MNRGGDHLIDSQQKEADHGTGDIDQSIDVAYLMKMGLVSSSAMHRRLRFRHPIEDGQRLFLNRVGERALSNVALDLRKGREGGEIFSIEDVHFDGGEPSPLDAVCLDLAAGELQLGESVLKHLHVETGVDHGAENHIAADAGEAIKIGDSHASSFFSILFSTLRSALKSRHGFTCGRRSRRNRLRGWS